MGPTSIVAQPFFRCESGTPLLSACGANFLRRRQSGAPPFLHRTPLRGDGCREQWPYMADRLTSANPKSSARRKTCPVLRPGSFCIEVSTSVKLAFISEEQCICCGIRVKKFPFDAIEIINLTKDLEKYIYPSLWTK